MKVLIIGGNRFLGIELTARLLARGDQVTILNRGTVPSPFAQRVTLLTCDRSTPVFDELAGKPWDAVVDFALFDGAQAARTARVLQGQVGHYIAISTGQVYLVRDQVPFAPAKEEDAAGPLMAEPTTDADREGWQYGVDKRAAEEVISASTLPATRLRIPMVHGGRDYKRRIESLLWRLLDGGPILLTRPEAPCRHVYGPAVVRALVGLLDRGPTGDVFNLAQAEVVPVRELVDRVAHQLGVGARVATHSEAALAEAGVSAAAACAFNSNWMSLIDPSKAVATLHFEHEPLDAYLHATVQALLARFDGPPPSLAQRPLELALG